MWSDPSSRSTIPVEIWIEAFDLPDRAVHGRGGRPRGGPVFSWPPESTVRPSGLKATNQTWLSWRKAGPIGLAGGLVPELGRPVVAAGQDGPAVGADGQGTEQPVVPERRAMGRPVAASQSRAVRSHPPVITVRPSGLKAATETGPSWCSGGDAGAGRWRRPRAGPSVVAAGQDGPAVGAERHGHRPCPCAARGVPIGLAGGGVPEPRRPVLAAGQRRAGRRG